jgi:polar amino acid transport system substrate-binding protein
MHATSPMLLLLILIGLLFPCSARAIDRSLQEIQASGIIRIGVKTDFPPFGMLNSEGKPIGFEIDMAEKLARHLGVRASIHNVNSENRFQILEQGTVDLLIATVGVTVERRNQATAIEPPYYGAGVSVIMPKSVHMDSWQQLRGQNLCALQGAYFNRPVSKRYFVNLQLYRSVRDAKLALKSGHCIGYLYTDVAIHSYLLEPEWQDFHTPLPSTFITPWAIFIRKEMKGSALEYTLGDLVAQWHREGMLADLAKKWSIPQHESLQQISKIWKTRLADGRYLCARNEHGEWPFECRDKVFVTSADASGITGNLLWLKEQTGLDLTFIQDPYESKRYLTGILYTLALAAISTILSLIIGYWSACFLYRLKGSERKFIRLIISYGRTTPPLLQMYFVFFGIGTYLWREHGISLSPLLAGIVCLSVYHGAIIAFAFYEAAKLINSRKAGFIFCHRELPELVNIAGVGIRSALTNQVKAITIVSALAVPEILSVTLSIIADNGNIHTMMLLLLLFFYLHTNFWVHIICKTETWISTKQKVAT